MKYLVLPLILMTLACGKPGSNGSAAGSPNQPGPGENTYIMRLTGDNVTFTMLMIADKGTPQEEQVFTGTAVTVPVGGHVDFTATGFNLKDIQFSYTGPQQPAQLNVQMFRNAVPLGSGWLTTTGTFSNLPNMN